MLGVSYAYVAQRPNIVLDTLYSLLKNRPEERFFCIYQKKVVPLRHKGF